MGNWENSLFQSVSHGWSSTVDSRLLWDQNWQNFSKNHAAFFFLFRKYLMTVTFCIKGVGKAKLRKPLADLLHLFHLWFFHSFRHVYNTLSLVFTQGPFPIPLFLALTPVFPARLSFTLSLLSVWGPELNWVACTSMEELRKGYPVPQVILNAISPLGKESLRS